MSDEQAIREIQETAVLVDYLLEHGLDLEDVRNFTDSMVRKAVQWSRRTMDRGQ